MQYKLLILAIAVFGLTGCTGFQAVSSSSAPLQRNLSTIKGNVHGGQNPIGYAALQVYAAGTTGTYGSGATALIPTAASGCNSTQSPKCYYLGGAPNCVASGSQTCYTTVLSDGQGNFAITGDYSCTLGTDLYLTATGGNPGSGTNNSSLLMTGFGLCDNLPNISFLQINEITTVGTVWALAPFISDTYSATTQAGSINIGAPSTNVQGLNQAFADINTLINYQNGYTPGPAPGSGATVPAGTTVPSQEIFAIADSLAACVNTTGAGACTMLFGYTTVNSVSPNDTVGAALNMADYPAVVNARAILQLGTAQTPWPTTFLTASDLTLTVTYTGNGISAPSAMAVDASGNLWIANSTGNSITELAHNGTSVGNSPYATGGINAPAALAIDTTGNIWIANGNSSLTELSASGANVGNSPFTGGGLAGPSSIAFDGLGNVWLSNYTNGTVSEFSSVGTPISTAGYTVPGVTSPVAIAVNPH